MHALKFKKALYIGILLTGFIQTGHAAAIQDTNNIKATDKSSSLIVKALDQQKRNPITLPSTDDELKMLNTLRTPPAQSFFAAQNQRFSRFVQSLFQQQNS